MSSTYNFFATAPKGLEPLVADEIRSWGYACSEVPGGVSFEGPLEAGYRTCLWSRVASRVLFRLAQFPASSEEALYDAVRAIPWEEHLAADGTLAVDAIVSSSVITHSAYAALKVKDAVVDRFRDLTGTRPSVDTGRPDIRINLHLRRNEATLSLDFSSESLHRRGYREEGGAAPLKENLAAGILLYARWPQIAAEGGCLVDPMCGSGTFPIEAALMAGDVAPGLGRDYFGFLGWSGHDADLWQRLLGDAESRREEGRSLIPHLYASDRNREAVALATRNAARAGVAEHISFSVADVSLLRNAQLPERPGLLVVNPPYGERLGEVEELKKVYANLGAALRERLSGWKAAIFTGNPVLFREVGIRPRRTRTLYNGPLECRLFHLEIVPSLFVGGERRVVLSEGGQMFVNRLHKNLKTVGKWAEREGVSCYRLYDADMPEYAVAVDVYSDGTTRWVHLQEYDPPKTVDEKKAALRLREAEEGVRQVLEVDADHLFLKVRRRTRGKEQYVKLGGEGKFHEVVEGGLRFLVNFTDYLDTGLFLDHRPTRSMIGSLAPGKRFLNLFAYTGAATVHAAAGGAVATTSVDMSRTYLDWAKRNMALNGFSGSVHRYFQADCLEWLRREKTKYDLIFLDPPTFSNSKRMDETFDVQRDHVMLLKLAGGLLAEKGVLVFSNNNRRFRMDTDALDGFVLREVTTKTIPRDFERNPRIHNCWIIERKS